MKDKTKTNSAFVIAIIALLSTLGLNAENLTDKEYDNLYYCELTGQAGFFDRLSGTEYSAYPAPDSTKGAVRCKDTIGNKGVWVKALDYAEQNNIDVRALLYKAEEPKTPEKVDIVQPAGAQYTCSPLPNYGCVVKEA